MSLNSQYEIVCKMFHVIMQLTVSTLYLKALFSALTKLILY